MRLHRVPLFHRRVATVPFNLAHPVWFEDPDFDLDYHVRRVGVPEPGGRRELGELAAQIASVPLDRTRPLWEVWVAEGLKQGRVGIITKIHHAAIDGVSGADIMVNLFDLEPIAIDPDEPLPEPQPDEVKPEHVPSDVELLGYAGVSRVRKAVGFFPMARATVEAVVRVTQGRRDPERPVGAIPLTAPRCPWNTAITPHRAAGFARASLDDLKTVKHAYGVKLNDVMLAMCAGTLRRYLLEHHALPDAPLVVMCPISVHDPDGSGQAEWRNRVSSMFCSLATDLEDADERLIAISESTKGAKQEHNAIGAESLMRWAEYAPPNLFNLAARLYARWDLADRHRPLINAVISNVPGPPFPLYYAGAEMLAAYPMGPVADVCGLNITVFSYRDWVDIGFMVCPEPIPDVWDMAAMVEDSMQELVVAARKRLAATG
jgi:WS/DGAT/MGAT family acyltransferase